MDIKTQALGHTENGLLCLASVNGTVTGVSAGNIVVLILAEQSDLFSKTVPQVRAEKCAEIIHMRTNGVACVVCIEVESHRRLN